MAVGSTGTLSSSSITVSVGESGQITWSGGAPSSIVSANANIATVTKSGLNSGTITVTGVSVGNTTATIQWAEGTSTISITVAASDDTSFLNKRGLAYFWDKIDNKKQNKLTAGSNITISGNTISASQPTVNNGQLTIQKNGSSVGTFTANQSGNTTANIVTDELKRKSDTRNSMRPSDANIAGSATLHFTTIGALDSQTHSGGYADALMLNSWDNNSGGRVNALVASKQSTQKLYHYTGDYNGSTWSGKKELAYADEYLPLTGGILTGNVGINELDNGGTYFHVKDSSQGTALSFGVGSGHVNHGIWSNTLNKWMMYGDATNVYLNGNANTATSAGKLTTARTIGISGGATGTATSFNGTANISIPITDIKDAYVTWGGKSLAANVTPDDMGCIDEFGHNKLAFLPAECITIEYTTDGGTTWTDYGATDAQKVRMVSTTGTSFMAGGPTAVPTDSNIADFKVRVRVASMTPSGTSKLYSAMVKCLLNITTNGASGTKVAIRSRTVANYKAGVDTWVDRGEFDIGGWSGWNSIPFNYTFGGTSDSQLAQFEFVFWGTGKNASYNSKVAVIDIRMIGRTNWTIPSEMARAGHLYTVDESQNATFPAKVTAPMVETGTGANNYFQSQKFRGQGDASSYYHAVDFGYAGHNQVDFYEYGGIWNFWRNTGSTATTDTANLALGIGIDALKNKSYTYTFPNKTGTFALTSDIPSVPTVNNGTLTIQKNGSNVATFTANQSGNATANITVPTKTSDITNDSGFLTSIPKASASTLGGIKVGSNLSIDANGVLSAQTGSSYSAGNHIDITNGVISAEDYVHSDDPVSTGSITPVVTNGMVANGTLTASKFASGELLTLTMSTTDIGEGAALAANTLYGVYD